MSVVPVEAADVRWDLSDLAEGPQAVDALLDRADARAADLAEKRGTVEDWDAASLSSFMAGLADLYEDLGRAGSYASLRFATDVTDPARGALVQRVQERSTAIGTTLLWFELEWAALDDDRAAALL